MKLFFALAIAALTSAVAQANEIRIQGSAPEGTQVSVTVGYLSTENSFMCTKYSFEDFKRKPKLFDASFGMNGTAANFWLVAPADLNSCGAQMISFPSVEVVLPGTESAKSLGFKSGGGFHFSNSAEDETKTQLVECEKVLTSKGVTTACNFTQLRMGPSKTAFVEIREVVEIPK